MISFEGRHAHAGSDTVQTLKATPSTHRDGNPVVFTERTRKDGTADADLWDDADQAGALTAEPLNGIEGHTLAAAESAVRRLTPLECERLQGFPDGWTCLCQPLEGYAADPDAAALRCSCPDSPRYRALGNAVTVTVITWLGQRLKMVVDRASTPQ